MGKMGKNMKKENRNEGRGCTGEIERTEQSNSRASEVGQ